MMNSGEDMALRINIEPLLKQLAVLKNQPITTAYTSRQTGLAYDTVRGLRDSDNRRIDMNTLESILSFLREEGLENVTIGDLFEETA